MVHGEQYSIRIGNDLFVAMPIATYSEDTGKDDAFKDLIIIEDEVVGINFHTLNTGSTIFNVEGSFIDGFRIKEKMVDPDGGMHESSGYEYKWESSRDNIGSSSFTITNSLSGTPEKFVIDELTLDPDGIHESSGYIYEWQQLDSISGKFVPIDGATEASYVNNEGLLSMRAKISYLDGNQFNEEIIYELNNKNNKLKLWEEIEDFNNSENNWNLVGTKDFYEPTNNDQYLKVTANYIDQKGFDEEITYELINDTFVNLNNISIDNIGSSSFEIIDSLSINTKKFVINELTVDPDGIHESSGYIYEWQQLDPISGEFVLIDGATEASYVNNEGFLSMRAKISYLDGNEFYENIVYELNNGLWEEIEAFDYSDQIHFVRADINNNINNNYSITASVKSVLDASDTFTNTLNLTLEKTPTDSDDINDVISNIESINLMKKYSSKK